MRAQIKAKREKRQNLYEESKAHLNALNDDTKSDADRQAAREAHDKAVADMNELSEDIDRMEASLRSEAEFASTMDQFAETRGVSVDEVLSQEERQERAFHAFLQFGPQGMSEEQRADLRGADLPQGALTTLTPDGGGITIPTITEARVESAMKAFGGIRRRATVLNTATGSTIVMPTEDNTTQMGEWIDESAEATEEDPDFGSVSIGAHNLSSKTVRIPIPLIQDSLVNMQQFVGNKLGERFGRTTSAAYTAGDGVKKPLGLVSSTPQGREAAAAGIMTFDDLLELKHSVDPAYRQNAAFAFNDKTLLLLKKIQDGDGRPLWAPGVTSDAPSTIDGDPYEIIHEMPDPVADSRPVLYGDFSKFYIRDVASVAVHVMRELFIRRNQIGLVGFLRTDAVLLDAGTGPIKHLAMPA